MKTKNNKLIFSLTLLLSFNCVLAQEIISFEDGYITFKNENPELYYRIEFKPNLTDSVEWNGTFTQLRNIKSDEESITVAVGSFYRVVGRVTPWVAGTASPETILENNTAYVNDEEISGTMPNIGEMLIVPNTTNQVIPIGFHNGLGVVTGDVNLTPENIRSQVSIFGVVGVYVGEEDTTAETARTRKTGQTVRHRVGDDGHHEAGVPAPENRFVLNADGTVVDTLTGLMWIQAPHSLTNNSGTHGWNAAVDFCEDLDYAGHSDWRLPNVLEMQSIIDYGQSSPALPDGHPFLGVRLEFYHTSTTHAADSRSVWGLGIWDGRVTVGGKGAGRVWPVRSVD